MRDLGEVAAAPVDEREVRNVLAIKPFRHLVVYPQMFGAIERDWKNRPAAPQG